MILKLGLVSVVALTSAFAMTQPGCSDNEIDRIYDCDQICDKYKDCVDPNYDDDACGERCREEARDNEAYEDQADECQSCVDGESCTEAVFGCSTECAGIVP